MISLVERIQIALDHANLSWSGAAVKLGLSAQAASKWKKGQIGRETLKKLAELTTVNSGWLLDGSGDMHPAQSQRMGDMVQSQSQGQSTPSNSRSKQLEKLIATLEQLESDHSLSPSTIDSLLKTANAFAAEHKLKNLSQNDKSIDYPFLFEDENDSGSGQE